MNGASNRLFSRRWGAGGGTGPGGYGIDSGVDSQQLYLSGSSYRAVSLRIKKILKNVTSNLFF